APVCAAIEQVLAERDAYGEVSLDLGLKSPAHMAIATEIERWRRLGVEVRVAYSRVDAEGQLEGTTVQESLRSAHPDLAGAVVVAVGQNAMIATLRAVVAQSHGDPDAILTNL
ncbi:MAG: hypothetical protein R3B82_22160, partial [Sandaracinaceae bacterium]